MPPLLSRSSLIATLHLAAIGGLFACPLLLSAANIGNGAPAMDVLGQYDDSLTAPAPIFTKGTANNGPNKLGMNSPFYIAIDTTNHRLFVADGENFRVLVYNLNSSNKLLDRIPDNVIGQPNFYTNTGRTTQNGFRQIIGVEFGSGSYLFVNEGLQNRIMVFNVSTITNGMNASIVLGQTNFTSSGAATTQSGLNVPYGSFYDTTFKRLFVGDTNNGRVLVFSGASLSNGMNANAVLGKSDFTTAGSQTTQSGMSSPSGFAYDASTNHLFISDANASRVLVFTGSALGNGMNANAVIGQANFTSSSFSATQAGTSHPRQLAFDSTKKRLFVGGHLSAFRVMVFSGASITNGMNANTVIGQPDFTTTTAGTTQAKVSDLTFGVAYDNTTNLLYVGDGIGNRVLIFSGSALANGMNANDALGQYDDSLTAPAPVFTKSVANNGPSKLGLSGPSGFALDTNNRRLFVCDQGNNRILVYNLNANNTLIDRIPDYVLGQANFYTNSAAVTQSGLNIPSGIMYDNGTNRLFVGDYANNRVLVFSGSSLATGMNANTVIGQTSFTARTAATTQSGLSSPEEVAYDSVRNRLFIADLGNDRVLVYSGASLGNGMNAYHVLGQANYTSATGAATQAGMNNPYGMAYDPVGNRLFVSEWNFNRRVLVFNAAALSNGMNASYVLGEPDFTSTTAATTQSGLSGTQGLSFDSVHNRLFVADSGNNRIMVFDTRNISNGMNAVNVLGQSSFSASSTAVTQTALNTAPGVFYDATTDRLYVVEYNNNRVSVFAAPVITGKVFSDEGSTGMGASKIVAVALNGNGPDTATGATAGSSFYTIPLFTPMTGGTIVTLYLDNGSEDAAAVTLGSGSSMTGMHLYQDRLIVRSDSGSVAMSNAFVNLAENGDSDLSSIFTVDGGVLNVKANKSLVVWSSKTFTPGAAVNVGSGTFVDGTLTLESNALTLSGNLIRGSSGTLNAGTSTVRFDGSATHTVSHALTLHSLHLVSGTFVAPPLLTLTGNFTRENLGYFQPRSGTVTLSGTSQSISGSTIFSGLTKTVTSADTLTFTQNTLQQVEGTLTLAGASNQFLSLVSSSSSPWKIKVRGTRNISYLSVHSSTAEGVEIACLLGCRDGGGNTNWIFSQGTSASTGGVSQGGGGGGARGGGGGGGGARAPSVSTPAQTKQQKLDQAKSLYVKKIQQGYKQRMQERASRKKQLPRPTRPRRLRGELLPPVSQGGSPLTAVITSTANPTQTAIPLGRYIVNTTELRLRSDSRQTAHIRSTLFQGETVTVLRIAHDIWVEVLLPDGRRGFAALRFLQKVE